MTERTPKAEDQRDEGLRSAEEINLTKAVGESCDRARAEEVNAALATGVMGWVQHAERGRRPCWFKDRVQHVYVADWSPWTNIAHALEVAQQLWDAHEMALELIWSGPRSFACFRRGDRTTVPANAGAPTPAQAISLAAEAALAALEEA